MVVKLLTGLLKMSSKHQPLRMHKSTPAVRTLNRDSKLKENRVSNVQSTTTNIPQKSKKITAIGANSNSLYPARPLQKKANNAEDALALQLSNLTIQGSTQTRKHSHLRFQSPDTGPVTIEGIAGLIRNGKARRIVVMTGAGISTPSGIPDFRTPGTGLYDNLQQYNIPYPEAIFDIDYFHRNPKPFLTLARELYPNKNYHPNYVHYFLRLLHDKGLLLRLYTQNIDGLERSADIPPSHIIEAHGTFFTASCTLCKNSQSPEDVWASIFSDKIPRCYNKKCQGVVKPDIVFFGEDLPERFYLYQKDFHQADLLLVLGTSLEVEPFAGIVNAVQSDVPRLLFNRELVGPFRRRKPNDVASLGDIVEQVKQFVDLLGWSEDMENLVAEAKQKQITDTAIGGSISKDSSGK